MTRTERSKYFAETASDHHNAPMGTPVFNNMGGISEAAGEKKLRKGAMTAAQRYEQAARGVVTGKASDRKRVREYCEVNGVDPLEALVNLVKDAEIEGLSVADKTKILMKLLDKSYPDLKAVDVKADVDVQHTVKVMAFDTGAVEQRAKKVIDAEVVSTATDEETSQGEN